MHKISDRLLRRAFVLLMAAIFMSVPLSAAAQGGAKPSDAELKDTLMKLEKEYWQAFKDRDGEKVKRMMGEDGIFVNVRGIRLTPEATVEEIMRIQLDATFGPNVILKRLGPDAALIDYEVKVTPTSPMFFNGVAVFVRRANQWIAVYHHEAAPRVPAAPSK
jgi:hypothetical protein